MLKINKFIAQGRGLAAVLLRRAASVELTWQQRQGGEASATDSSGRALALALPAGSALRGGDVLVAEDGSLVQVRAAPQAVLQVRACTAHGRPRDLLRAAFQLGTQHVALELQDDHLCLLPDPAWAQRLREQHLILQEALAPFDPEPTAWGEGHLAAHAHDHAHDHPHEHGPAHAHDPSSDPGHGHVHGPGCGHGH